MSQGAFDILGAILAGETTVTARVRPGRTIEMLEAEASCAGRVVIRATAWRLSRSNTSSIAATDLPLMPPIDGRNLVVRRLTATIWSSAD